MNNKHTFDFWSGCFSFKEALDDDSFEHYTNYTEGSVRYGIMKQEMLVNSLSIHAQTPEQHQIVRDLNESIKAYKRRHNL